MILLIASRSDIAGTNIANHLLMNHYFHKTSMRWFGNPVYSRSLGNTETMKLVFIEQEIVNTQSLAFPANVKLLIFLSRHSSKSGTPTLSVHTPGNLGEASLGGIARTVSVAPANAMKEALKVMKKAKDEMSLNYEVSYECTHHGPSLNIPTMFVELGSSVKQWKDPNAAEAVARAAIAAASYQNTCPAVIGIGGPHYNMNFTRKALSTETAFGHIIPKYAISEIDVEILRQCVVKTVEHVEKAVLDWKGIKGADKERLLTLLREIDLETERI